MSDNQSKSCKGRCLPILAAALAASAAVLIAAIALTANPAPDDAYGLDAIARSIGTPPWPVPNWIAFLYPWQSLLGGVLALVAAVIGAIALQSQSDAARQNLLTELRHQRNQEAHRRREMNTLRATEREELKKQLAGALSGEMRSWIFRFRDLQLIDTYRASLQTASNGVPPVVAVFPIYNDHFPIFEAGCSQIGIFPGRVPHDISVVYSSLRSVLDTFRGIRDGDYSFLNEPPPSGNPQWEREMAGRANRAAIGIEQLLNDLVIIDTLGSQLLQDLDHIRGESMPDLPRIGSGT